MQQQELHTLESLEGGCGWFIALCRRILVRLEREARRRGCAQRLFDAGCGTGGLLRALSYRADVAWAESCDIPPLALADVHSLGLEARKPVAPQPV